MKRLFQRLILAGTCALVVLMQTIGFAQVDPSSALLLRSSGKAPNKEDLDSSRYQVRERPQASSDERRLQSAPSAIQKTPPQVSPPADVVVAEPVVSQKSEGPAESETKSIDTTGESSQGQGLGEVLLGGSLENIHAYRQTIAGDDYRQNIVDLSFEPLYIYNDSSSNFWLRDYTTSSPGLNLAADVWITPFFGFHTSYQTSLNASVSKDIASSGKIAIDHEWFHAGLRFRKFFGVSKQASGLMFNIDFSEYQLKIESSAQNRMGLKSSGVKLGIDAIIPKSDVFQWNLGFSVVPRVDHKQVDTGLSAQSGDNQESTRMGVHVGGRFIFSRKSQFYWKLSHEVEKNLFEGESSINDPRTLAPIEGVEVTNGFTIFRLGYTWGN